VVSSICALIWATRASMSASCRRRRRSWCSPCRCAPSWRAEHVERDVLELDAEVFGDHLAAGQDGDVFQHGLAAIAEARRLDGRDLEAAAQLVDDQGGQRLAFDVLGDDQQRLAGLHHRFEQRQHRLQAGELLLVDQDVGVLELGDHLLGVGDEVGREIAAVELHAFDDFEFGLEALGFFDRDDAFVADLLPSPRRSSCRSTASPLAEMVPTWAISSFDLTFLERFLRSATTASTALSMPRFRSIGFMPAAPTWRLRARSPGPARSRWWCRRRRVVGLGGDFAHHLRAHVLELVGELDFLGDGDAVLGDARRAEALVDDDVAALGITPSCGFSLAVSGMMMPPRLVSFSSVDFTRTRSPNGFSFIKQSHSFEKNLRKFVLAV
jgi:hypothetical protein